MHDCPTCRVPLHGHEEVCPSCGTKQYVKPEFRRSNLPPPPGVNPMPFVAFAVILAIVGIFALKSSWIFQAITNPVKEDPLAKMSPVDARAAIENQISTGLAAIGSKATFKYTSGEQPALKNSPGPIQLTVETSIKDPNQRKGIIDPIKDYMGPAQMSTLTVNDGPHHRTWTYTASLAAPMQPANDIDLDGANSTQTQPVQPAAVPQQ